MFITRENLANTKHFNAILEVIYDIWEETFIEAMRDREFIQRYGTQTFELFMEAIEIFEENSYK